MAKNTGLGKGINALFGETYLEAEQPNIEVKKEEQIQEGEVIVELKLTEIEPNLGQARKFFDEKKLQELALSIQNFGVIQPIIVEKKGDYYEIIAGERRWRASKLAGLKTIPAIIRENANKEGSKLSIIENVQRENLNPIEKARGYKELIEENNYTIPEFAKIIGKSPTAIGETLSILELDDKVLDYLVKTNVSETSCKTLLITDDPEIQMEMALYMLEDGISADEAKRRLRLKEAKKRPAVAVSPIYKEIEEAFTNYFGNKTKLKVSKTGNKNGQIIIKYNSTDDLERIMKLINKKM